MPKRRHLPPRLLVAVLASIVCASAAWAVSVPRRITGLHDARYCEILELNGLPPTAEVTVYNSFGLSRCPARWWNSLNASALARELGSTLVILNGPRHFLMDSGTAVVGGTRSFHGVRMTKAATIAIHSSTELVQALYTDRTITRTNTWRWNRGRTVFELVAPGGDTYVMQSYAQIKDKTLTLADLPALGSHLKLPPGWRFRARKLARPLVLSASGRATVIQDDLQDTYQLATTARRGKRARHAISLTGQTHTVTSATPETVEDHGTVSGAPFGHGTIVLVGTLTGGRLTGKFRLTYARGSIEGTTLMPFKISAGHIHFAGTSELTGGTGAYRGISSSALPTADTNTLDGKHGTLMVSGNATY